MGNKGSKGKKGKKGKKGGEPEIDPTKYDFKKIDAAKRIFGVDMEEVLKRMNIGNLKSIPPPILALMDYIEHNISSKEVFKKEGSKTDMNTLNYKIDVGEIKGEADLANMDIHVVVANLKKYIRALPGGLLPFDKFAPLGEEEDQNALVEKMKEAIAAHLNDTIRFFYFHVARLLNLAMENGDNGMDIIGLTQVFRMNLMDVADPSQLEKVKRVCDCTIQRFKDLFPNQEEYALERPKKEEVEGEAEAPKPVEEKKAEEPAVEEKKEEALPPAPVEEVKKEEEPPAPVEEKKEEEVLPPAPVEEEKKEEEPAPEPVEEKKEEEPAPPVVEEPVPEPEPEPVVEEKKEEEPAPEPEPEPPVEEEKKEEEPAPEPEPEPEPEPVVEEEAAPEPEPEPEAPVEEEKKEEEAAPEPEPEAPVEEQKEEEAAPPAEE